MGLGVSSEMSANLCASAFSSILGQSIEVASPGSDKHKDRYNVHTFSIHQLFRLTHVPHARPPPAPPAPPVSDTIETYNINIKSLTGRTFSFAVSQHFTVLDVKILLQDEEGILPDQSRLIYNGRVLEDEQLLEKYGIGPDATLHHVLRLRGGGCPPLFQLDPAEFDPAYDYDFTDMINDGRVYIRGGHHYNRPYGWKRLALKVVGQYVDELWLGNKGIRTKSSAGEWPVSYHGTQISNASSILQNGLKPGCRNRFGKGVYSSPSIDMVAKYYAHSFFHEDKEYQIVFQNRVNPERDHLKIIDKSQTGVGVDYWVSVKHNPKEDIHDVRPYGILIREAPKD